MRKLREQVAGEQTSGNVPITYNPRDYNLNDINQYCTAGITYEFFPKPNFITDVVGNQVLKRKEPKDDGSGNFFNVYLYVTPKGKIKNHKVSVKDSKKQTVLSYDKCEKMLALTPEKKSVIDSLLAADKSLTDKNPGAGNVGPNREYTEIDVADTPEGKASGLFADTKGKFLLYKRTGLQSVSSDMISKIESIINKSGWTLVQPTEEGLLDTVEPLTGKIGSKYIQYFTQSNQKIPPVWRLKYANEDTKKGCRTDIKNLYNAFKNPSNRNRYNLQTLEARVATKDRVCQCLSDKTFLSGIFGLKNEIEELLRVGDSQGNDFGLRDYCPADLVRKYLGGNSNTALPGRPGYSNESEIRLKNIVREHLIRLSESNKKKILDESKIAKKRFNVIIENNSVKTKKQKNKLTTEVIREIRVLNDMGFSQRSINEGLFDSIGSIFGSAGEGILEMIKENFAEWIIKTLTPIDPNGWLGTLIKVSFGNLPVSDLGKLTDCGFLTSYLAKDIVETIGAKGQSKMGLEGGFYDFFRNAIFDSMDKSELGQKIQGGLSNMLCGKLPSIQSKMDDVQAKFKEGALQAATK